MLTGLLGAALALPARVLEAGRCAPPPVERAAVALGINLAGVALAGVGAAVRFTPLPRGRRFPSARR